MTSAALTRLRMRYGRNSSRAHLEQFIRRAAGSLPSGARMLDAGAGHGPYRRHFSHACYESADFAKIDKEYADLTYVCDLRAIPVEDGRFDLVLLTQVLEHLPDPRAVLRELYRVLRPGGRLWLSAPFFYEEHEQPYDFFRYTRFGLHHLVTEAGFVIEEIDWLEGYAGSLAYQLDLASRCLSVNPRHYGGGWIGRAAAALSFALRPGFLVLSFLYARLDTRYRDTSDGHCKNYTLVAEKPTMAGSASPALNRHAHDFASVPPDPVPASPPVPQAALDGKCGDGHRSSRPAR